MDKTTATTTQGHEGVIRERARPGMSSEHILQSPEARQRDSRVSLTTVADRRAPGCFGLAERR